MALLAWIVLAIVAIVVGIAFLQRFYRKSTRDTALLRTGAGGRRVALDGGFFALPMLHRVDEINMRAHRVLLKRAGESSLLTEDRLRVDVTMEFRVRVNADPSGVAAAAQTFGARALRSEELGRMLEGRFADVIQSCSAVRTLDALHEKRAEYVASVREALAQELNENGLRLESVALVHFDQTPFSALNENNVFNSVGMRKLAEIVATNKKRRAETESDADISVAQTQLFTTKRRIELNIEQEQAQIGQRQELENSRTRSEAEVARAKELAQLSVERARLDRERDLSASQIERDHGLDMARLQARLALEVQRVNQAIELSRHQEAEALASIDGERAKTKLLLEQEGGNTEREMTVQRRQHELALARMAQESETDSMRVKAEVSRLLEIAQAEADAARVKAAAQEASMVAEAAGAAARISADNAQTPELMDLRLQMARLEALPKLAEKMVKPLEKIESIRINHLSGMSGSNGGKGAGSSSPMDAIYDMALNLPMLKKLGESMGADLDLNIPQLARAESDHFRAAVDHQKARGTSISSPPNPSNET
ncbi:MAG: flotillin domain-containing protein [Rhodoferax sp.]|nr:flotillin domain-containing protein [Rhodoferax sp.]